MQAVGPEVKHGCSGVALHEPDLAPARCRQQGVVAEEAEAADLEGQVAEAAGEPGLGCDGVECVVVVLRGQVLALGRSLGVHQRLERKP